VDAHKKHENPGAESQISGPQNEEEAQSWTRLKKSFASLTDKNRSSLRKEQGGAGQSNDESDGAEKRRRTPRGVQMRKRAEEEKTIRERKFQKLQCRSRLLFIPASK